MGNLLKGEKAKVRDMTPREYKGLRRETSRQIANLFQGRGDQYEGSLAAPMTSYEAGILNELGTGAPTQLAQDAGQTLQNHMVGRVNPFAYASETEGAALGNLMQQAFDGPTGSAADAEALRQATLQGQYLSPESNPFLRGAIETATRPLVEQFGDEAINRARRFGAAGHTIGPQGSSPFEVAEARAQTGLANALGDISSRIVYPNYAAERGRQMGAIDQAEQAASNIFARGLGAADVAAGQQDRLAGAGEGAAERSLAATEGARALDRTQLENTLGILQAQALPRLIEEHGIERGIAEFNRQQNTILQALGLSGQLSSPTVVQQPGRPGVAGDLIGAAGLIGAAAVSDIRLKRNIKHAGHDGRFNLYTWDWNEVADEVGVSWQPTMGVIAQEVMITRPDAVSVAEGTGLLMVDYEKLYASTETV